MNREELFENIKTLASEERDERRKENKEILRELKEIKELLKEKNNSNNRVNGSKLEQLGPYILQIETDKQYSNGSYGVYICELTEEGHRLNN